MERAVAVWFCAAVRCLRACAQHGQNVRTARRNRMQAAHTHIQKLADNFAEDQFWDNWTDNLASYLSAGFLEILVDKFAGTVSEISRENFTINPAQNVVTIW